MEACVGTLGVLDDLVKIIAQCVCQLGEFRASAFLFAAADWLEPNRRLAIVFKCAILAAGGTAIAEQL